jgi:putative lipoprotein
MQRPRFLLLAAALLVACSQGTPPVTGTPAPSSGSGTVSGTVTYRQRIALPPSAVVTVQLVDVSLADAPSTVLGEQRIEANGKQVPFAYAIAYDPAKIVPNHEYAVQARIEDGGRLLFSSDQRHPVLTRGAPATADLALRQVAGAP